MVAQECTPTPHPQRDRICSAFYPYYDRTTPVVFLHPLSAASPQCHGLSPLFPQHLRNLSAPFPQHLRSVTVFPLHLRNLSALFPHCFRYISAVFLLCFPVSPHCCRSPSAVFGSVNLSEKTVAETLSNQRLMYSAMVSLFNTLSVCSLLLMSPLPFFRGPVNT